MSFLFLYFPLFASSPDLPLADNKVWANIQQRDSSTLNTLLREKKEAEGGERDVRVKGRKEEEEPRGVSERAFCLRRDAGKEEEKTRFLSATEIFIHSRGIAKELVKKK